MLRGDFVNCTEEELNSLKYDGGHVAALCGGVEYDQKSWKKFLEQYAEEFYAASEKDSEWSDSPLSKSINFRKQCVEAGFRIQSLYPIYYQGWEMDNWGAIGTKGSKHYILETSHGNLCKPLKIEPSKIKKIAINVLNFLGVE